MTGALYRGIAVLLLMLLLGSCANIVPPTGGDKDETPPKLRNISPPDSQLSTRVKKLELSFDEYIVLGDAATQVHISPLLPIPLTLTASSKRVTVIIPDSLLQDATTYRITFGNAIRDLHEGNPWPGSGYTFSTGTYFDSLSLAGSVFDARTGLRDTAAQVMLYAAAAGDSAVVRQKPLYVVRADGLGNFRFEGLPARPFRLYALRDANSNLTFDGGAEWIAFADSIITPGAVTRPDVVLRTFPESLGDTIKSDNIEQRLNFGRGGPPVGLVVPPGRYIVGADTSGP